MLVSLLELEGNSWTVEGCLESVGDSIGVESSSTTVALKNLWLESSGGSSWRSWPRSRLTLFPPMSWCTYDRVLSGGPGEVSRIVGFFMRRYSRKPATMASTRTTATVTPTATLTFEDDDLGAGVGVGVAGLVVLGVGGSTVSSMSSVSLRRLFRKSALIGGRDTRERTRR